MASQTKMPASDSEPYNPSALNLTSIQHPSRERLTFLNSDIGEIQFVMRWFEADIGRIAIRNSEEASQLLHTQQRHLQALEKTGIAIPSYASFIAARPNSPHPIAIYQLVEAMQLQPVSAHSPYIKRLGGMLLEYTDWINQSGEEKILWDVFTPGQYGLTPDDRLCLMDIEPRFDRARAKPLIGAGPTPLTKAIAQAEKLVEC